MAGHTYENTAWPGGSPRNNCKFCGILDYDATPGEECPSPNAVVADREQQFEEERIEREEYRAFVKADKRKAELYRKYGHP